MTALAFLTYLMMTMSPSRKTIPDTAETRQASAEAKTALSDPSAADPSAEPELSFDEGSLGDTAGGPPDPSFWREWAGDPLRFTLKHEMSEKFEPPVRLMNNRTSARLEYGKLLLENFFVRLDYKLSAHWGGDHLAKASAEELVFEDNLREAYLQASFHRTSLKAGYQILIWGQSEVGDAITDEISPRNYSELFFVSLEESRLGQPMAILEQYSTWGEWSLVFVPFPALNQTPGKGTAYFRDPFGGGAVRGVDRADYREFEYGLRWKKALGKSDIGLMAASLMDNDPVFRLDGESILKEKSRFSMAGLAFNYSLENFLLKGEMAAKHPKTFSDSSGGLQEKPVLDASLGFDFSRGGTFGLSLEAVHNRVLKWNDGIRGVPEAANTLVLIASDRFLNENLSVNLLSRYSEPYATIMNIFAAAYKLSDRATLELEAHFPFVEDERSPTWFYRDQKQVVFRWQYQL